MAASTAGAIKALLEAQGLGVAVYRAPITSLPAKPVITVDDGISLVPDQSGDFGSATADDTVTELDQVNVWETAAAESYTLVPSVLRALHGAVLVAAPTHVYGCSVDGSVRLVEDDRKTVHTAITVRLRRAL